MAKEILYFQPVSTTKEIVAVALLARDIWTSHYVPIIGRKQVDYMLKTMQSSQAIREQIVKGYQYFLVKRRNENIGYAAVQRRPQRDDLFVSKIYLYRRERGKGCGKQIMNFITKLARDQKLTALSLTVNKQNTDSIKFYEHYGFANQGPVVQDIGSGFVMDDYRMLKPI